MTACLWLIQLCSEFSENRYDKRAVFPAKKLTYFMMHFINAWSILFLARVKIFILLTFFNGEALRAGFGF